jgi:hypothetical protein
MSSTAGSQPEPPAEVRWVPAGRDSVFFEGEVWLICPVRGFECGRVPQQPFGEAWARDVMAVHVAIHHKLWR